MKKESTPPKPQEKEDRVPISFTTSTGHSKSQKPAFNRWYWDLQRYPDFTSKKQKFLEAVDYCEKNNLGSKSKLRRLAMKLDKWQIENERDMDALLPEYDYLVKQIEDFEMNK